MSIYVCSLDDLFEIFSPAEQAQLVSLKAEIDVRMNAPRREDTAALGFVLAAVTLPECDCRRLVPMGTDMSPADVKALRDPTWRRTFETRIGQAPVIPESCTWNIFLAPRICFQRGRPYAICH